jgi:ABC-type multidrug transport system fused ATPase/permease subunit
VIKKLNLILNKEQKLRLKLLILSSFPLILLEAISISSLPIFLITILKPSKIFQHLDLYYLENLIINMPVAERSFYGLLMVLFIFLTKTIYNLFFNYFELNTIKKINLEHSNKIYSHYLKEDYLFYIQNNPSKLIQNIDDVKRSTSAIFSVFHIVKETILIFVMVSILIFTKPSIIIIIALIFSLPVIFFLSYFKSILKTKGKIAKESRILRLKNLQESFSLIKFIKIIGNYEYIKKNFELQNHRAFHQDTIATFIARTPRILLEFVTVLAISVIILFLLKNDNSFEAILPLLSLIVITLVRFMPAIGTILVSSNQYKFHHVSITNIYNIFNTINHRLSKKKNINLNTQSKVGIVFEKKIEFSKVEFSYPNSNVIHLKNINFNIDKNSKTGIKGPTGSGKSTLISLLLGLLKPNKGEIRTDKFNIHKNLREWQSIIGYVPQTTHLVDDTIKKNICFGIQEDQIDIKKLEKVINISGLDDFINSRQYKFDTIIGHDGTRLSGGQLQRIGIARALYLNPKILVLDEPTSSLDRITEEKIFENILSLDNLTVILISHNPKIIEKCDNVLIMDNKTVISNRM